ncbi:MAG: NADH-quinone oxidoreductase subunit I [Chloroflexi bacterium]|nr:NADH-quinone oxidoreductase subunit I [Chloroflexota bacterium]
MYGLGIIKGMAITMKHFVATYLDDIKWLTNGGRYYNDEALQARQGLQGKGAITVFYPEEKLPVPERFRFVPFLVTDDPAPGEKSGKDWCTACGICAKVCPPQCIWIERAKKPNGRPKPEPATFSIDIDICMNCGLCAEFCPFDAIKMDHDYELASYDRTTAHIHDKERLSKPLSYWQEIAPQKAEAEAAARDYAKLAKQQRKAKKQGDAAGEVEPFAEDKARQLYYRGGFS